MSTTWNTSWNTNGPMVFKFPETSVSTNSMTFTATPKDWPGVDPEEVIEIKDPYPASYAPINRAERRAEARRQKR